MKPDPPLQPLRIPRGWTITYNSFFDVEPRFRSYDETSWQFSEDMLQVENHNWRVVVDLGWYPSHRSTGHFGLVAMHVDEDGKLPERWRRPLRELRTRSRKKVVKTLEAWLLWYSENVPPTNPLGRRGRKKLC